ncbi:MAG: hypothetical protein BWK73_25570 [Thiothrix lacustris]|uniref:Replication protein n=1 Tax=Thiothrix lacustris TaxID=525917 RepID=A0A1Y1QL70_9GAMM|nr:MAG: hypothetical protein BWK73_25570 [Thiothrix lacustris]
MPIHDRNEPDFDHIQTPSPNEKATEYDYFGKRLRPLLLRSICVPMKEWFTNPIRHLAYCFHRTDEIVQVWHANIRLKNSQSREAAVKLLSVMVLNMDMATMLVGYRDPKTKAFQHYKLDSLAEMADLTYPRARRAFAWLKSVGIISNDDQVCEKNADGTFTGKAAPKRISERLFDYFGMGNWLKEQRDWSSNRLKEGRAEESAADKRQREATAKMQHEKMLKDLAALVAGKKITPTTPDAAATSKARSVAERWADISSLLD